jgi:A/G-specific adenine glycosylase
VKRVLARYCAVDGWPGEPRVQAALWDEAERHTPHERLADYTQAIMDLGATLCTRSRPACTVCPLASSCAACAAGTQARHPAPRPKRARPQRRTAVVVVRAPDGRVLLERRPAEGIWGGLHSLPECAAEDAATWCQRRLGARAAATRRLATIAHGFTHFDLDLEPWLVELAGAPGAIADGADWSWHSPAEPFAVGVPAPIAALLNSLTVDHSETRGETVG